MTVVTTAAGQSLATRFPEKLPAVWADRDRLRQIVQNLLINASKFTQERGEVTLRARQKKATLVIEVSDNGSGIPKEDHKRLFMPYHRSLSDREHLSGLGLGLALCKYLVDMHDGEIWVDSEIGKGSTFGFSLPLASAVKQGETANQETVQT